MKMIQSSHIKRSKSYLCLPKCVLFHEHSVANWQAFNIRVNNCLLLDSRIHRKFKNPIPVKIQAKL